MKSSIAILGVTLMGLLATGADAGPIERACNKSDRDAANRAICACLQQVADLTLDRTEQGRAAKLLNNPEKAHALWMSTSRKDDVFWDRYTNFGAQAEVYCTGV